MGSKLKLNAKVNLNGYYLCSLDSSSTSEEQNVTINASIICSSTRNIPLEIYNAKFNYFLMQANRYRRIGTNS